MSHQYYKSPLPFLYNCFISCSQFSHLIDTSDRPLYYTYPFLILSAFPQILLDEGIIIRDDFDPPACFNCLFPLSSEENRFFMDGSKSVDRPFAGFAVVDILDDRIHRFRVLSEPSIFSCKAMALLLALRIALHSLLIKISIFSDSKSVLCALLPSKKIGYILLA